MSDRRQRARYVQTFTVDVDDDGGWFVRSADGRKINCGSRPGAMATLACIRLAADPLAEFNRIVEQDAKERRT